MYRDLWVPGARESYRKLDPAMARRVDEALQQLCEDPTRAPNVIALKGPLKGLFRRRIGDLRLIYSLSAAKGELYVRALEYRGSAYR